MVPVPYMYDAYPRIRLWGVQDLSATKSLMTCSSGVKADICVIDSKFRLWHFARKQRLTANRTCQHELT